MRRMRLENDGSFKDSPKYLVRLAPGAVLFPPPTFPAGLVTRQHTTPHNRVSVATPDSQPPGPEIEGLAHYFSRCGVLPHALGYGRIIRGFFEVAVWTRCGLGREILVYIADSGSGPTRAASMAV